MKLNTRHCSFKISLLFAICQTILATTNTTTNSSDIKHQNDTQPELVSTSQRPKTVIGGRAGRMLDLDRLSGEVGKSDKGPSLSGNRQSRILSDGEERSRKSASRKMSINGFIPIVSLDSQATDSQEDESEQPQQQQQQPPHNLREHLQSSYGGQTSMGHASFPSNEQWQQVSPELGQETARAQRKLLGASNLFGGLMANANKGFGSHHQQGMPQGGNYNPIQHQQQQYQNHHLIGGPMNMPIASTLIEQQQTFAPQTADCICVPFFQCKNGYLSESQLSKSQLIQASQYLTSAGIANQHQAPRSIPNDYSAPSQSSSSINQQQFVNDIYDQLRKNIESANLEQQAASALVDERNANQTVTNETEERSLISRRQQGQQKCGIMRTCCRVPPPARQNGGNQHQQHIARFVGGPSQMSQLNLHHNQRQQSHSIASPSLIRPQFSVPPVQLVGPPQPNQAQLTDIYQPIHQMTSGYSTIDQQLGRPQASSGSFMSGRCGQRQTLGIAGRVQNFQGQAQGESSAEFGEFPAHAAILKRMSPGDSLFVCSAVLISNQWLATAAHCLRKYRAEELKIRLGEWDVNKDDEFYPFFETNVREFVLHPEFQSTSLINDIALVRLEQPVDQAQMPHVAPACIGQPEEQANFVGQRCWVAGWGKDAFGQQGSFQSVLKKVDLPVVSHQECEMALRHQTKLGRHFRLHQGNICAGGEQGKDACEGDGGGGLYCVDPQTSLVKAVGLVSWGVGCGQRGVPGVFVSMAQYSRWIESVVVSSGEENVYLDARTELGDNLKGIISERSNQPTGTGNATISAGDQLSSSNNITTTTTTTTSI